MFDQILPFRLHFLLDPVAPVEKKKKTKRYNTQGNFCEYKNNNYKSKESHTGFPIGPIVPSGPTGPVNP